MDLLLVVLHIVSGILALIAVTLVLYSLRSDSRRKRTIIVILSFLLVLIFGTLGILGDLFSLGLALTWVLILFLIPRIPNSMTSE